MYSRDLLLLGNQPLGIGMYGYRSPRTHVISNHYDATPDLNNCVFDGAVVDHSR